MLGTNVGFTITRDGQFSGYKVRPDKPNLSFAVMHQMWSEKSSLKPYSVVPKPDEFDMQHPFKCHDLQVQDWKTWDPFMPGSKNNPNPLPQFGSRFIALPCDPTAPAFAGVGGCGMKNRLQRTEISSLMDVVAEEVIDRLYCKFRVCPPRLS